MRRFLPVLLAATLTGCTTGIPVNPGAQGNLASGGNLTTVAPLSSTEAGLKTKEGLASLNSALSSLRDLKGSSSLTPRGSAADLQQAAAGYRILAAAEDEYALPDTAYEDIEWFYETVGTPVLDEDATDYILTERVTEEGRENGVAVEHYETTVTTRIPKASNSGGVAGYDDYLNDWGSAGGTYTRDEVVTLSEFRKLGHYVTTGTTTVSGGKPVIQATQDFTPQGGTKTYRLTLTSSFADNGMTFDVKGDAPGGGTLDLKSTSTYSFAGSTSTATFAQQGTIVTAKGETILLDTSMNLSNTISELGTTMSAQGHLTITFKDQLVLKFTLDQSNAEDKSGGAIYAADGTTKMGTIAMSASDPHGTVTFNDGSTQSINMQTIADLMNVANSFSL